jgi:hypothetical protein
VENDYDERRIRPNGLEVRRRRHAQGWSRRHLIDAIAKAQTRATGVPETITPRLLSGIEEQDESIPYRTLCLVADGLDCDPVDILQRTS